MSAPSVLDTDSATTTPHPTATPDSSRPHHPTPPAVWFVVCCAAAAAFTAFQFVLPARLKTNESGDYRGFYEPVARSLADGRGLRTPNGDFADRYPPGYPAVLAAVLASAHSSGLAEPTVLMTMGIVCWVASTFLVLKIAEQTIGAAPLTGNRRWSWLTTPVIAALLWASYPIGLWLTKQPNVEQPFLVIFLGTVWLYLKSCRSPEPNLGLGIAIGVLTGLAALIRPIAIGLSLPLIAGVWLRGDWSARRRLKMSAAIVAANAIAVAPWLIYDRQVTGRWVPLSSGGTVSILDGLTILEPAPPFPPIPGDVRNLMINLEARRGEMAGMTGVARVMIESLGDRPSATLKLLALKAIRVWWGTESQRYELAIAAMQAPYLLAACAGLIRTRRSPMMIRILLITLYFWLMAFVALSILRYMVPVCALLMIPTALTLRRSPLLLRRSSIPDQSRAVDVGAGS